MHHLDVFWNRPGLNFFPTCSGLADMPLANRTCPRNNTLVLKNWHFLGLIFRLKFLCLSYTRWMQPNISIVGAKMQMSSRYSNKVTNCWSPKHCSIKWQKLEPVFESPNGIWVNSYRPIELALNAVFFYVVLLHCKLEVPLSQVKRWEPTAAVDSLQGFINSG